MSSVPCCWNQVIDPQHCVDLEDFLNGVKYNEDALTSSYSGTDLSIKRCMKQIESTLQTLQRPACYQPQGARDLIPTFHSRDPAIAPTQLVGAHPSLEKAQWLRDDTVISKGNTLEHLGARPCCHCGGPKHWVYDCNPHALKGAQMVKANYAQPEDGYT